MLTLVVAAFFLIIRLEPVAAQIATVGYYMLVVGVVLEFKAWRKKYRGHKEKDEPISTETESTPA